MDLRSKIQLKNDVRLVQFYEGDAKIRWCFRTALKSNYPAWNYKEHVGMAQFGEYELFKFCFGFASF